MTILFLFIRDKFGPVEFVNFLKGKYLRPKREERIFMFTDLKSSTAIAERLGEERYFNFFKTREPHSDRKMLASQMQKISFPRETSKKSRNVARLNWKNNTFD